MKHRERQRDLWAALAFLLPNFLGFVVFTAGPVLFSLAVSFTNWNLQRTIPFRWIGLGNFQELFTDPQFWLYFVNTVYFMLGMPIAIAGSLLLAILLSQRLRGIIVYRTLFYLPTFTSGVALMILWKSLYNPEFGPINSGINWVLRQGRAFWAWLSSPELGPINDLVWRAARIFGGGLADALTPRLAAPQWLLSTQNLFGTAIAFVGSLGVITAHLALAAALSRRVPSAAVRRSLLVLLTLLSGVALIILWSTLHHRGLDVEEVGLAARQWGLGARDAIIFMGIWIAIGGSNMLLYLAALSNVPQELYEAAQIDGAGKWATFCHVTWPQLAPTTFFIVVMSFIGGLQGGFEQARVMTAGGPAGTTTTLAYYIYVKAFQEFEIGYASAISWVLFVIIFAITLLNWRFGAKELSY